MTKGVILLITLFLCLFFVACNAGSIPEVNENDMTQTAGVPTPTERTKSEPTMQKEPVSTPEPTPRYEEVKITLDNWQTYFEIGHSARIMTNEFDEPYRVDLCVGLVLKPEYKEKWEDGVVAFAFSLSDPFAAEIEYDKALKTVTIGNPYSEDKLEDDGKIKQGTFDLRNGAGYFWYMAAYDGSLVLQENHMRWVSTVYKTVDITMIQGTITLVYEV